jgi:hypothetical protein
MQLTPNYKLKKPEGTDPVDIQDFNDNADLIDAALKKKAETSGGDISEMTVKTLDTITTEFPVPVAGESQKSFLGKVKKFFEDTKNWMSGVCLIGQIVNNCVTNNAKLPLSAAQGKVLMDLYTVLNNNLGDFKFYGTLESLGISGTNLTYQDFVDHMPVNSVLSCRVNGVSFMPTTGEYYLKATCTGYNASKRINFEAIAMYGTADQIYNARYSAPAGTQWSEWETVLTNADIQAGNTPLGDCVPGKTTDFQITFPKPFPTIPKVMVCLRSSSQSEKYGLLTPYVANISTTGFTFRVANAHTGQLTPGGTWHAML